MSTAGKVLTVLVLLVMIGWIVMLSAVTQLNTNWQERIAKQDKTLRETTERVDAANKAVLDLTEATRVEQTNRARDLRDVEDRILAAERRQSSTIEDLTRLKTQVADYLVSAERAKQNKAIRDAEYAQGEADLVKKKDEIAKAQGVNAELRDQLAKLQDEFKRLLTENSAGIERAAKDGAVSRPASSRRTPPAS